MNVIADRLFSLLLGWTRGLFNNLWNLVTNHSSGIAGFLERFWLPLILLLLLIGTAADYIIWLIRWRPHWVWRSWLMRRGRERRLQATQAYMQDLDQAPLDLGYSQRYDTPFFTSFTQDDTVVFPEQEDFPYPQQPEMVYPDEPSLEPQQDWQPAQEQAFAPSAAQGYSEPELPFAAWTVVPGQEEQVPWQEYPMAMEESHQPAWDEVYQPESYQMPLEQPEASVSRRRRRTETRRQRQPGFLRALRETLIDPMDPDEQLDSLPSPIAQEDAFHQPYYPENYRYRPAPQGEDDQNTP